MTGQERICLDLFSGLGGFSQAFEDADNWSVVTVDFDPDFNPDITSDVLEIQPSDLPNPDVVLASPPCDCFTVVCQYRNWEKEPSRNPAFLPRREAVGNRVHLVYHTLWLIYELQPDWWFLENPRGMLRKIIGAPTGTVCYCQYGSDWMKPTDLWGVHPPSFQYKQCKPRSRCHNQSRRNDYVIRDDVRSQAVRKNESAERAKVPYGLSKAIMEAVTDPGPTQSLLVTQERDA